MAAQMITNTQPPPSAGGSSFSPQNRHPTPAAMTSRSDAPSLQRRSSSFNITKVTITWLRGHPNEFPREMKIAEMERRLNLRRVQLGSEAFEDLMELKVRVLLKPGVEPEAILEAAFLKELMSGEPFGEEKFKELYTDSESDQKMPDDWEQLFSFMD